MGTHAVVEAKEAIVAFVAVYIGAAIKKPGVIHPHIGLFGNGEIAVQCALILHAFRCAIEHLKCEILQSGTEGRRTIEKDSWWWVAVPRGRVTGLLQARTLTAPMI